MKMKRTLIRLGLAALVSSALFGCGGGGDGVNGATVTVPINVSNAQSVATNAATPSAASVAAWQTLQPKVTVLGVSINSPPVVKFAVTDANGNALVGLDNYSQATATARFKSLTNVSFTLAKLVPETATAPSKWVSYLVTKPTTVAQLDTTVPIVATESCTADRQWCGTYPTTDKEGVLTDNKDGTYSYEFRRDVKLAASIVASLPDSTDGLKLKADLGDLTYDPSATHRIGIVISGNAPGTGTNTPNAIASATTAAPMAIASNTVYDFRPDGGAVTATRSIVDIASCASCHNGKTLAHGSRKDPNLCVTCHTDQIKYGMSAEATRDPANALKLIGTTQNTTSVVDGRAVGNYPNFVHKIHMGDRLGMTGYNYIPNATTKVGLQFEKDSWIQDPRDCTKCHNGSYDPTTGVTDTVALAAANADKVNVAKITKDGDNWKNKPSRLACGACHDDVSFTPTAAEVTAGTTATGLIAHPGGAASDDSSCASCHAVGGAAVAPIDVAHRTEAQTANNPVQISGISTITYDIKKVEVTSGVPSITFRILKDGVPVTTFATPTPTQSAAGVYSVPSTFQPIAGFRTGPTFYIAYAMPQDGITAPADFNTYQSVSLTNLLVTSGHPKAGTLAPATNAADAALGYLKATLTGSSGQVVTATATAPTLACPTTTVTNTTTLVKYCANPSLIKIPTTAKLVTGAMIGNFNQIAFPAPTDMLTQVPNDTTSALGKKWNTLVAGSTTTYPNKSSTPGVILKTPLAKLAASATDARRVAVDTAKCESCHEQLGTAVEFHGGARNNPTACAICHNTSKASGGWTANASTFIHGIHAGTSNGAGGAGPTYATGKRTNPFSWVHSTSYDFGTTVYPGILKRCDNCHVPNAVNFGANGATIQPNLLWPTAAYGSIKDDRTSATAVIPHDTATPSNLVFFPSGLAPATTGTDYGNAFSFVPEGSVVSGAIVPSPGKTVPAAKTTLVESPITSACFACHDSNLAQTHMKANGGVIYGPRLDPNSVYSTFNITTGSVEFKNQETCLVCHGMGRDQDAAVVHAK
jgi:OmcA/MtrC family decaheme c-type cytochrome